MVNCQKCGARIEADDLFCPDCGAKIIGKGAAPKREPSSQKEKESYRETLKEKTDSYEKMLREKLFTQPPPAKKRKVLKWIIIIIIFIILFRGCMSKFQTQTTPQNTIIYTPPSQPPNTGPDAQLSDMDAQKRLEEEMEKKRLEEKKKEQQSFTSKADACFGVKVEVMGACFSCGLISCGLIAGVKNTGTKPIIDFKTKAYNNEVSFVEGRVYSPLNVDGTIYPGIYYSTTDVRMIELTPIVVIEGEEVVCENSIARFGNAYGEPFKDVTYCIESLKEKSGGV